MNTSQVIVVSLRLLSSDNDTSITQNHNLDQAPQPRSRRNIAESAIVSGTLQMTSDVELTPPRLAGSVSLYATSWPPLSYSSASTSPGMTVLPPHPSVGTAGAGVGRGVGAGVGAGVGTGAGSPRSSTFSTYQVGVCVVGYDCRWSARRGWGSGHFLKLKNNCRWPNTRRGMPGEGTKSTKT